MQPLFTHNLLELWVWVASLVSWRILEAFLDIRTFKRLRAGGIQLQDKGSRLVLLCLIGFGLLFGIMLAYKVDATSISIAPDLFLWLAILLMVAGIALRLYAIITLGTFFTTTVAVAAEQTLIETGPYRLIRHPSYTGFLMILLGFGLSFTNWLSVLVIMSCALVGFSYRIQVEEQVLLEKLGEPYQDYMWRTKRLIPFVL